MVIATIAVAALDKSPTSYPPVTLKMTQATTDELLWKVAEMEHLTVVGKVPEPPSKIDYREDYSFVDTPVEEVLAKTYSEWKLVGNALVVTPLKPRPFDCGDCRMEYLLQEAPAATLLPSLESAFPNTSFTPHPTLNGFYARGSKDDLLEIKRILLEVDHNPVPPLPARHRRHQLQWLQASVLEKSVEARFPQVHLKTIEGGVQIDGRLPDVDRALEYAKEIDREPIEISVSLDALRHAQPSCRIDSPYASTTSTVDCPPNCHGPLQLLGLQNGDVLPDYYNDPLRTKPEWWVQRDGKDYRIVLKLEP